jgi:signal transduction histidine kinase
MRERVEMAGGSFEVQSNPGHGTTVTAVLALR